MSSSKSTAESIARLNEGHAIAGIGSYKRDTLVVGFGPDGDVECLRDFAAFRRHLYHERPIKVGDDTVSLAEYWLRHKGARRYRSLVFAPPGSSTTPGPDDFNTWRGLAVTRAPGDWRMNRQHILGVICAGNEEHERWLHNWIAAMLQQPGKHGWVAPVLKGGQGIGKGYFLHEQVGGMFRPRNYAHLTSPEHLTGDFNSHLEDRVYVFADEAVWGNVKAANKLKGLITETDILINRKHVPQEIQQSALHIVIASNAELPLPVERDCRRLFVLQVAEDFKQDQEYFAELHRELREGGREAMLDYFLAYDVDWDLLRLPPDTDAKREMKAASLSAEDEWWREVLDTAAAPSWGIWESRIARSLVLSQYSEWFDRFKSRGTKKSVHSLGSYFARHFKTGGMASWPRDGGKVRHLSDSTKRDNSWRFPPLAESRAAFDRATGTRNEWPDEPTTVH